MTKAQELGITQFPFEIKSSNGKLIYRETSDGYWYKREYDANGNESLYENSDGYWSKREYDANGNETGYETSNGYWAKWEYDTNGNRISYEDSNDYWSRNKVMKKIHKGLFIFMIALTILWFGLIITYSFSSGETAGRIGDAIDLITPILFVLGAIGMVTNSED